MNDYGYRHIDGTSALKPDCSRYRNENEHIIDFERAAREWEEEIDYLRISRAQHVCAKDRFDSGVRAMLAHVKQAHQIRKTQLEGTPFGFEDEWEVKALACCYTVATAAALILFL